MISGLKDRINRTEYALNGIQALKAIYYAHTNTVDPYHFDLIFIECDMLELSGIRTTYLIRSLYEYLGVSPAE